MSDDLEKFRSGGDAKYNSHLDILQRINWYVYLAGEHSRRNDLNGLNDWWGVLDNLEREIIGYCKPDQIKKLDLVRVGGVPNPQVSRQVRASVDLAAIRGRLRAWELVIREIIAAKGMGLKTGNDARLAL